MKKVFYVFAIRWTGDTCPVEYAESRDALIEKLVSGGWQQVEGSWFSPKDYPVRQISIPTGHGNILEGYVEDGIVVADPSQIATIRSFATASNTLLNSKSTLSEKEEQLKLLQHEMSDVKRAKEKLEAELALLNSRLESGAVGLAKLEESAASALELVSVGEQVLTEKKVEYDRMFEEYNKNA